MIFGILKNILFHPFNYDRKLESVLHFLRWQIISKIWDNYLIYNLTENTRIIVKKGLTGVTGNIYTGLYEFEDMLFSLHLMREDDIFYDIGANVGVYSVLISGEKRSNSYSFEPTPDIFSILSLNIKLNNLENKVKLFNCALGNENTKINFRLNKLGVTNHISEDLNSGLEELIEVDLKRIDDLNIKSPNLIKIDVEGFEFEVLKGANSIFKSNSLYGVIIELNGSGKKYGITDLEVHQFLLQLGFFPVSYNPFKRQISILPTFGSKNTIYIKNQKFVEERLLNSLKVKINNKSI